MKKQYKALMLDLDGTTIPNKTSGVPSEAVVEAIAKASDTIAIGIISGRTYRWALPIMEKLSLTAPSVVSGGAQIIDPITHKILVERSIGESERQSIQQVLQDRKVPYLIPLDDPQKSRLLKADFYDLASITDLVSIGIPNLTEEDVAMLMPELESIPHISINKLVGWDTGMLWLQINELKATKEYSVSEVANMLDISTDSIIGVGDGFNDIPLLHACGLKVAMGNAVPELKAIADYVAPSVDEDGVVDIINKFVL